MKNRALIALITVVAAVFGMLALNGLKQELAPSIQFPELAIVSSYPGASPEVVNNDVTTRVAAAIRGVANLDSTSGVSSTNQSIITAKFDYGTDLATAEQKLNQAINRIQSTLPSGVTPQVFSGSINDLPVIQLAATSTENTKQLGEDITRLVLPEIKKLTGVNDAQLIGQIGQRVSITPDAAKLAAAGLSAQSIKDALQQNGTLLPGGSITEDGQTLTVQSGSELHSVEDIAALPLVRGASAVGAAAQAGAAGASGAGASGLGASGLGGSGAAGSGASAPGLSAPSPSAPAASAPVTIGDVAAVALTDDPVTSLSRVNGKPSLTIAVTKLPSANTVDVSKAVNAKVASYEATLGHGAKFTVVFDQAPFIEQSISSLAEEGLLGLGFAVVVILIFLLSVRATIVTAISIPTSVLITFIGMQTADYTLNIITLGALTIAIGRVVDDSIVVIENIKRHLVPGADRATTVVRAVREVAGAITASTLTTVAVFLPVAFVGDVTGELFRPFALTVTIALLSSLLVALTIVPVLAYWFLRAPRAKHDRVDTAAAQFADAPLGGPDELEHPSRLQRGYLPIIHWTLKHSAVTIILAVLVLGGTLALVPSMKTNFLGSTGQNTFTVSQKLAPGASLQAQDDAARVVEKKLQDTPGVKTVQLSIGSSGSALRDAFLGGGGGATFSVTTDPNADQDALQATVQKELKSITGEGDITMAASSGFGGSNNIEVDLTAPTAAALGKAASAMQSAIAAKPSIAQVTSNLSASLPYLSVAVDRSKAAAAGLSEVAVGSMVSQAMRPTQVGTIAINDTTLTIYLQNPNPPTTVAALKALPIATARGPVPLSDLAQVAEVKGPATVTTQDGNRSAALTITPATDNLGAANADVSRALTATALPAGATASIGGVSANQSTAFSQLGLAMLAAILIVYVIMVATFRSLRQPLLLLVSIPFAATGAIALQVVTGIPLGVASLIGVLMLIGIVVTNAIVLIDLVNQYRRAGMSVTDAVAHGASRRLRPILMTALATIFALLPMAVGLTGHGGFISQPLALVVIGGLVSSTLLTLVVLPTLYNLVEGVRERRAARKGRRGGAGSDATDAREAVHAGTALRAGTAAHPDATASLGTTAQQPDATVEHGATVAEGSSDTAGDEAPEDPVDEPAGV